METLHVVIQFKTAAVHFASVHRHACADESEIVRTTFCSLSLTGTHSDRTDKDIIQRGTEIEQDQYRDMNMNR